MQKSSCTPGPQTTTFVTFLSFSEFRSIIYYSYLFTNLLIICFILYPGWVPISSWRTCNWCPRLIFPMVNLLGGEDFISLFVNSWIFRFCVKHHFPPKKLSPLSFYPGNSIMISGSVNAADFFRRKIKRREWFDEILSPVPNLKENNCCLKFVENLRKYLFRTMSGKVSS